MNPFRAVCAAAILFAAFSFTTTHAADLVQHVVCLKFKEGTSQQDIHKIEDAFRALKAKINLVLTLEWGTNVSKENRAKGFTHCFILKFIDEKDVMTYAEHPDHKAFGALLKPFIDDVFVIDFHTKE
jgi:hypothetical protein